MFLWYDHDDLIEGPHEDVAAEPVAPAGLGRPAHFVAAPGKVN